jgi:hypothetical protein
MFTDLILDILAPIAAKRYAVVRKALWVVLAIVLLLAIYGGLTF